MGHRYRHLRVIAWLKRFAQGVDRVRTLGLAAEMSFWLFLALVPLAAVAGMVAARVATSNRSVGLGALLASVPPSVRGLIAVQVEQVASWQESTTAPLALVTFVWLASSGVHAVFDALEVQSGTSRPWWKKRLIAIGVCVAFSFGVASVALLAAGIHSLQSLAGGALPVALLRVERGPVGTFVRWCLGLVIAVSLTAGLYRVGIARGPAKNRFAILPGAIVSVALQTALGWLYGVYVATVGSGGAYQAGLAVVGVTLITLWLFSVALLLGVQLNSVVGRARARVARGSQSPTAETLTETGPWPHSAEFSSRLTSPKPPTAPSTGPSTSPRA